jgi:hypothetical protein
MTNYNVDFDLKLLGPLFPLVGKWKGAKGRNIAPDPNRGIEDGQYSEELSFIPIKSVKNHEQILYGVRYQTTAFENGSPFHEETGYWLWDPSASEVYRCFIVPRGITVIAGGKVAPQDQKFFLEAKLGSPTFGITSIPFLDQEFKTTRYTLEIEMIDSNTFSYKEITYMQMPGRKDLFEHLDQNTLQRC